MSHANVLRQWYSEVWEDGNTDAIERYFAPATMAEGLIPEMQVGVDEFRDLVLAFRHMLEDIRVELPKIIESEDWVSAILKVSAKRSDNGAPLQTTGSVTGRIENGKVVEAYNQFDFISLFEQLGQFPSDTLPICMTGQRLDWS